MACVASVFVLVLLFISFNVSLQKEYNDEEEPIVMLKENVTTLLFDSKLVDDLNKTDIDDQTLTRKKPAKPDCLQNEKWHSCLPQCPLLCENLNKDCDSKKFPCKSGCDCKSGHARLSSSGSCVPVKSCNDKEHRCLSNEEWLEGKHEPHCEPNCGHLNFGCYPRSHAKPSGDCYCKSGFVRDSKSDSCIKAEDCPPNTNPCPENEEFKECGHRIEELCEHLWNHHHSSSLRSCQSGCFCRRSHYRIDGKCQKSYHCPFQCGQNENLIGNKCTCVDGFTKIHGKCVCLKNKFEINNKCVNSIDCGHGTPVVFPPKCKKNCQQSCACHPTFSLIDGKCICGSGTMLVNGKCDPIIICNEGTPILVPPNCNNNCMQSCSCDPPFVFIGGVCTCPTDQVLINGACETKINCENGSPIIIPLNCTINCKQSCQCDENFLFINGECQQKNDCVNGIAVPGPENCTDDCEFQICECNSGFDNENGICECNRNEIAIVDGITICRCRNGTEWDGNNCTAVCGNNETPIPPACENSCGFNGIECVPISPDQICFCSGDYVRLISNMCAPPWSC